MNRSVTWASWDEELLALELQELSEADFDLDLTGFDAGEIDGLLAIPDEERANAAPPVPANPVSLPGDLWLCGPHRVLCGDATSADAVARLLGDRQPLLMVTDPPYGIELDSEWRDRAGLNGGDFGNKRTKTSKTRAAADPQHHAEPSYMKHRTEGHRNLHQRRYESRLVGRLRTGAQSPDRLRLACIQVHARSPERPATHRF